MNSINMERPSGGRPVHHADFGGMSQWSSGMTMVGDMFNVGLKTNLNAIAAQLSAYPSAGMAHVGSWWPEEIGSSSAAGSQNNMRCAAFPEQSRLVIDDHGKMEI
ncbi:hypothetical protein [Mesorhizobium caraganae]|uniref:hypothetical protein n=1 Tax=Mesorhizobium caraganae TaxID=483206 RepID=UPI00333D04D4